MKKRSLVAAIAMLLVSAVVLTSSTYAWFIKTASENKVDEIVASITTTDANLKLKATTNAVAGSDWKDALASTDFVLPSTIKAVSMNRSTSDPGFVKVAYDGTFFTSDGTVDTDGTDADLVYYGFDVQLTNGSTASGKTITMTPTFTRTSGAFQYAVVKVTVGSTSTYYTYGDVEGGYVPVTSISNAYKDAKEGTGAKVAILDSTDKLSTDNAVSFDGLGSGITANYASTNDITLFTDAVADTDGTEKTFTAHVVVWMWAEGNDPDCVPGKVSSGSSKIAFAFTSATVDHSN